MTVKACLLWGAGAWNITMQHEQKITSTHRKMVRALLYIRKEEEENVEDYMKRCASAVTQTMNKYNVEGWCKAWRRTQYEWAYKVVEQGREDPSRLTFRILSYKDIKYIHEFAMKNKGWQGHVKQFHAWRWETGVYNYFFTQGAHWHEHTKDKTEWIEHREKYLDFRELPHAFRGIGRIGRT